MRAQLSDEALLCLEDAYDLRIRAVVPMRSVAGILTDRGRLIVKRYTPERDVPLSRLEALASVRRQLAQAGLVPPYLETVSGESLVWLAGHPTTVEPWLRGRQSDFSIREHRRSAAVAVARLHSARIHIPGELRLAPSLLQKLSHRLKQASSQVEKRGLPGMTGETWVTLKKQAEKQLRALTASGVAHQLERDRDEDTLCHRDLAPHNLLIEEGGATALIDFDLAGLDSPLYDLHQMIGHMSYSGVSFEHAYDDVLDAYTMIRPLTDGQVDALWRLRGFPMLTLRELGEGPKRLSSAQWARLARRIAYALKTEQRMLSDERRQTADGAKKMLYCYHKR
ncbi:phosphotransferase [Ferroacidibacillus organovorans]|uniref:Aminoglycoside phosphotransferase domain-containing protein n=1 Tax=Ferroacidibacillus organovorans TaxID=1765683 RepID=A0A117SX76_9BACL|nr:phosphotransferase [Ferroacidibacillus organovorans]KUO94848.1 hypothetical protein ATW55_10610 [Ferroacidibacillus organovorans]